MPVSLSLVALAIASLVVGAQSPQPGAQNAELGPELPVQTPANDLNHVVCKKFPPPVGTRIGPRRICKTALEWQMIQDSDQEALERALRKPCDAEGGPCG